MSIAGILIITGILTMIFGGLVIGLIVELIGFIAFVWFVIGECTRMRTRGLPWPDAWN